MPHQPRRRRGSPTSAASAPPSGRRSASTKGGTGSAVPATNDGSRNGRHGKFNANGEHIDGHWFASAAEGERYRQLKELEAAGEIGQLQLQPTFDLVVNSHLICKYRADFSYATLNDRGDPIREIVEDVKGMVTPEFVIKSKLYNALHPVKLSVIEVKGKARHQTRPARSDKTGNPIGCVRGWLDLHWKGRIPE